MIEDPIPKNGDGSGKASDGVKRWKDGDKAKKFPNGIKATLNAIRKCWPHWERPNLDRNAPDFAAIIQTNYDLICSHYRLKRKSLESLATSLSGLDGSSTTQAPNIRFFELRAYAEHVGLPTGVFLIFTQALSYASQGRDRKDVLEFLAQSRKAIVALESVIKGDNQQKFEAIDVVAVVPNFCREESPLHKEISPTEFRARLHGLWVMREAYKVRSDDNARAPSK